MTKLPSCPRCTEPDLYLSVPSRDATITAPRVIIRCKECGWNAVIELPLTVDGLNKTVADVIAAARVPLAGSQVG